MAEPDLYVGIEPTIFDFEGSSVVIGPNTIVRRGHPIMAGRESLFRPLVVHFEVAKPEPKAASEKAEPAEKPAEKRATHTR